ncbi:MAG: tRNA (adenosine(37)-N6)-threonylcarbamoyltransferase complex dimerization subunit type 1 TsaB [Acidobacteria bacterium]|nr:MAG: tRNA (adenosine(37)-N6)-threonylcarbamoyltransferase complex dimerization subunit type 1 TsaB [Acidobacteriota bacterium]
MSLTLSIVTCGPQMEVALSGPPLKATSVIRLGGVRRRSSLLLAAVDLLIEDADIAREELSTVIVSRGPGSFTGIRSGLATARGLAAALGCRILAYDSLMAQAARIDGPGKVWAAQPGRRGEVYAREFVLDEEPVPEPTTDLEILRLADLPGRGPWIGAEALPLGEARRMAPVRSTGEALIRLADAGLVSQDIEPLYVEGPAIHGGRV